LKVEHVVVCGHHGCGAVAGALALGPAESSLVNLWVADIRDTRNLNLETLSALPPGPERVDRLVELNVVRQCFNVCTAPVVQAAWARGQKLAVHGLVYSLKDGLLRPLTDPVTGEFFGRGERSFFLSSFFFLVLDLLLSLSRPPPLALSTSSFLKTLLLQLSLSPPLLFSLPGVAALQAHVDNEDEPGWPHATHHGHSRRSMDLEGWSGPPSSADLEATEAAAAAGTAEAAAGTKAAVTAAAEKTASTTTTMVGDVAAAMSAGARLGDNNGCASGGGSGGGSGGSDGASPLKEGSGGGRGGGDTAASTTGGGGGGGGAYPHSPAASPPPPPAAARLPRPGSAAAIAAAVAGDAGSAATTATATASATANSPTAAAAGANNPSGRAVLPNSTACVATTTAALADGIAAHVAFASEDAAAAAEAKRAKEAREAAAATAGAAATGSSV
jgi:hypothetical protein